MRHIPVTTVTETTKRFELLDAGTRRHRSGGYTPRFVSVTYRRVTPTYWEPRLSVVDGPRRDGSTCLELFGLDDPKPGWLLDIIATEQPTL